MADRLAEVQLANYEASERLKINFSGDAYLVGPEQCRESTLISAVRAAAQMLRLASTKPPDRGVHDGTVSVVAYSLVGARVGMIEESLRAEFHQAETRLRVRFSSGATITAVWPVPTNRTDGDDDEEEDSFPYFYFDVLDSRQPRRPKEVRDAFPVVGIIPMLSRSPRGAWDITRVLRRRVATFTGANTPCRPGRRGDWREGSSALRPDSRDSVARPVVSPRRCEHDAGVVFPGGGPAAHDAVEVLCILRDEGPNESRCGAKELFVGRKRGDGIVGRRDYVVTSRAKTSSRVPRVMRVQDELQPERRSWPRRHSLSASSAAAVLASISASISSVNSA